jgi:hypothetical protein
LFIFSPLIDVGRVAGIFSYLSPEIRYFYSVFQIFSGSGGGNSPTEYSRQLPLSGSREGGGERSIVYIPYMKRIFWKEERIQEKYPS